MTPDELKPMPKGTFIMIKTGTHSAKTRLRLFWQWGILRSLIQSRNSLSGELEYSIRDKFSSQKSAQANDVEQEILKQEKKQ